MTLYLIVFIHILLTNNQYFENKARVYIVSFPMQNLTLVILNEKEITFVPVKEITLKNVIT